MGILANSKDPGEMPHNAVHTFYSDSSIRQVFPRPGAIGSYILADPLSKSENENLWTHPNIEYMSNKILLFFQIIWYMLNC